MQLEGTNTLAMDGCWGGFVRSMEHIAQDIHQQQFQDKKPLAGIRD